MKTTLGTVAAAFLLSGAAVRCRPTRRPRFNRNLMALMVRQLKLNPTTRLVGARPSPTAR
jgi:hypothetical protein